MKKVQRGDLVVFQGLPYVTLCVTQPTAQHDGITNLRALRGPGRVLGVSFDKLSAPPESLLRMHQARKDADVALLARQERAIRAYTGKTVQDVSQIMASGHDADTNREMPA